MPIDANSFLKMLGIGGNKKATGTKGSVGGEKYVTPPAAAPVPLASMVSPQNNVNLGTAGDPRMAGGPPPMADLGGGGMSGEEWLSMALSALGGGPDRAAYVAPFDAAEQRARAANAQALPQIAQTYDQMRAGLGQSQQVVDRDAGQAREQMAAVQAAVQQQMQQGAGTVMADLASQGGTPALGGLLGAAQAQIGTGQAQLAQQAGTQQQLSGNMQAASTASYQSRLADSQLAQGAATSSANTTLNQVLAQLDSKKAQALQQYSQDAQQYGSRVAQTKLQAAERAAEQADPMRQLDLEMRRMDVDDRRAELAERQAGGGATGPNKYSTQLRDFQMQTAEKNPVAWSLLTEMLTAGGKDGTPLPTVVANIRARADKNNKIVHNGKRIDATWLIDRAKELDDLEAQEEAEELRRAESTKRSSSRR